MSFLWKNNLWKDCAGNIEDVGLVLDPKKCKSLGRDGLFPRSLCQRGLWGETATPFCAALALLL